MATYFLGCSEIPNSTDPYSVGMPSPPPVHVSIFGGCQGRRTGVGVTTVSNSLILGGWMTKVLKNDDEK